MKIIPEQQTWIEFALVFNGKTRKARFPRGLAKRSQFSGYDYVNGLTLSDMNRIDKIQDWMVGTVGTREEYPAMKVRRVGNTNTFNLERSDNPFDCYWTSNVLESLGVRMYGEDLA